MYWVVKHASAMPDLVSHLAVKQQSLYGDNGQSNSMVIGVPDIGNIQPAYLGLTCIVT